MSLITFTSDFGSNSIYIATSRASLKSRIPEADVIDITHAIEPGDISEAAYVIRMVKNDFPQGTIHIIAVDAKMRSKHPEIVVAEVDEQYFISYNTGLLTMMTQIEKITFRMSRAFAGSHFMSVKGAFGEVVELLTNGNLDTLDLMPANLVNKKTMQVPVITETHLTGTIIYFDERGIAYTNIQQSDYDKFTKGKDALIKLTRFESLTKLEKHLADTEPGTTGGFFNEQGYLCIGIYLDDTRTMLGFKKGHVIMVENL